jgi:PAS domain S-box-containing protein
MDVSLPTAPKSLTSIHQALMELAPDGFIIADTHGHIVLINAQAERMFGYSRTELIDRPVELLMPERFRHRHMHHRQSYQDHPSSRPMGLGLELCGLHKSGHEFPIAVSLNSVDTELGPMVFTAIRDVSTYRQAEQTIQNLNKELERQNEQLSSVNQELEAFAYSISHDLRAPLRSIVGFGEILKEEHGDKLDLEGLRLLGIMRDSATKMGRLIDELLAFSRLNRRAIEFRSVDMTTLAQEAFNETVAVVDNRHITFDLSPLPPIQGSGAMLKQVWTNLIGNAVKYTRPRAETRIHVSATQQQREIWYRVKDNGVGFDMRYAHKLFGVFERLHGDSEFEGTGVGLALVQRIIGRHDGRIWADSVLGEGSTFTFALPMEQANMEQSNQEQTDPEHTNDESK